MTQIEKVADALRRWEQAGKKLNAWEQLGSAQKRKWVVKAQTVLDAFHGGQSWEHGR